MDTLEIIYKILSEYGLLALICMAEALVIYYLFKELKSERKEKQELIQKLLDFSEKRLKDVQQERDNYESLSRSMDGHLDLLVKIIRRRNGNGNGD